MYQLLENDAWLITDHCAKLIDCLLPLVRDDRHIKDTHKVDGDDPADRATDWSPRPDSATGSCSATLRYRHAARQTNARQVTAEDPTFGISAAFLLFGGLLMLLFSTACCDTPDITQVVASLTESMRAIIATQK